MIVFVGYFVFVFAWFGLVCFGICVKCYCNSNDIYFFGFAFVLLALICL